MKFLQLSQLIEQYFDINAIEIEQIKAVDTLVFKVKAVTGKCYIAKLYSKHYEDIIRKIAINRVFLQFVAEHTHLKIQVPPTPFFPLIKWEKEERFLVLCDYIVGEKPTFLGEDFMRKMGEMMATLHQAAKKFNQFFDKKIKVLHIDNRLIQRVKPLIINNKDVFNFDNNMLNEAFERINNLYHLVGKTDDNYGLIHSDLHFENVLINADGNLSPIDFDEVAYGHFYLDIAVTLNEIDDLENPALLKAAFWQGYKKVIPVDDIFVTQTTDFQRIAGCLYLNWLLHEDNKKLLDNAKLRSYGQLSIAQVLAS
jgi:Ser/Thr protein kinase RdoA (MazF antagonist)